MINGIQDYSHAHSLILSLMLWLPRCLCLTISVKDSTEIMEHLDLLTGVTTLPPLSTPKQRLASLLIELLGDEWLLPAAFHWRWAYTGAA